MFTGNKFNHIRDETEVLSHKSENSNDESTPFKRTPFKHIPEVITQQEGITEESFVHTENKS